MVLESNGDGQEETLNPPANIHGENQQYICYGVYCYGVRKQSKAMDMVFEREQQGVCAPACRCMCKREHGQGLR
jgi:hypothetical protein